MMITGEVSGTGRLTVTGKQLIAYNMYVRGKAFIASAILLKRQANSEPMHYVVLHLLCQGIEITLKGLLLLRDYGKYKPKLRSIGHDLWEAVREASVAYGFKEPDGQFAVELKQLNALYKEHRLRYAGIGDIFVNPLLVDSDKVVRRVFAAIRIADRELRRSSADRDTPSS